MKNGEYRAVVDFKLKSRIYTNTIQFVDAVNKSIFDALQEAKRQDKTTAISKFATIPTQFITAKSDNEYIMNLPQDHYIVFDEILSYLFGISTSIIRINYYLYMINFYSMNQLIFHDFR